MFSMVTKPSILLHCTAFLFLTWRLKSLLDKEDQDSEVIKDSPDSPEPLNKKPRLSVEEVQPLERAKGTSIHYILLPSEKFWNSWGSLCKTVGYIQQGWI